MPEKREPLPPVLTPQAKPVCISARVIAGILEKHSPRDRITHDTGFHQKMITLVRVTGDGKYIVTGGADGMVRMWDARSGKGVRSFSCPESVLSEALITPNDYVMITRDRLGWKTRIWDLRTGACLKELDREAGEPTFCNDRHLFCVSYWFTRRTDMKDISEVIIHDIASGKRVRAFPVKGTSIRSLSINPDNTRMAVLYRNGTFRVWDIESDRLLFESRPEYLHSSLLAFTPDGGRVVLQSTDGDIHVQDITETTPRTLPVEPSQTWSLYALIGFHLYHNQVDHESENSALRVIDIETGAVIRTGRFTGLIQPKSISADERYCLGFRKDAVDVWDLARRRVVQSLEADLPDAVLPYAPRVSIPKGFAVSCWESAFRIVGHSSKRPVEVPGNERIRDVAVTPDGNGLIVMAGSEVRYWDLDTGHIAGKLRIPNLAAQKKRPAPSLMALTRDGKYIVLPSKDGAVLRMVSTGRKVRDLQLGPDTTGARGVRSGDLSFCVTRDGKRLFIVSGDNGLLRSYDLETGKPSAGFRFQTEGGFRFFCDGDSSFFTAQGALLSRWDAKTGALIDEALQEYRVQHITYVGSRKRLAVSTWRGLCFWDCDAGRPLTEKTDEGAKTVMDVNTRSEKWIYPVPGGRYLLLQHRDCTCLWDIESRGLLWKDEGQGKNDVIKSLVFPDGKRFAQIEAAGTLVIRGIRKGETLASLTIFPDRFVWETPPDTSAPSGWLWTDREDLVTVVSRSKNRRKTRIFGSGDAEHASYMKIYNSPRMVMARIAGEASYRRQVGLYAAAMGQAKAGITSGNEAPASITAGEKGDTP